MFLRACLSLSLVLSAASVYAEDVAGNWPNFRGPEYTGVAPTGNPPITWDEETNVQWKVAIPGEGSGSPIVWQDRIFLQTAIKTDRTSLPASESVQASPESPFRLTAYELTQLAQTETPAQQPESREGQRPRREGGFRPGRRGGFGGRNDPTNVYQFVVLCIDRDTGETLWQQVACEAIPHEGHHRTSSFASYSPVTDGENLYVSFGSRGIYSYTLEGEMRWKRDLGDMTIRNGFGEGSSPALYGDTLIINWDHEGQSFITALDANTGETKWRVDRDEETTWLTPLVVEYAGKAQVIVNGMNRARSYDLESGEVIWECGGQAMGAVPTAVATDELVICMTGHRGSALFAIPLSSQGDVTGSETIAWSLDRDTPYVPSPILYGENLYFGKSNNAILSCYKVETGEQVFKATRLPGLDSMYSSPVGAADRIYFSGRNGSTIVLKHGDEFEVVATNTLSEAIDATPAIVGDQIIIRTSGHLYCIAE